MQLIVGHVHAKLKQRGVASTPPGTSTSVCSMSTTTGPHSTPIFIRTTIGPPPESSSASSAAAPS